MSKGLSKSEVIDGAMRILWVLCERNGGLIHIPKEECPDALGNIKVTSADDGLRVEIKPRLNG